MKNTLTCKTMLHPEAPVAQRRASKDACK